MIVTDSLRRSSSQFLTGGEDGRDREGPEGLFSAYQILSICGLELPLDGS